MKDFQMNQRLVENVDVTEEQIAAILHDLGLTPSGSLRKPNEGRIATNLVIATQEQGDVLVRLYPSSYSRERVHLEVGTLSFLAKKQVPVPQLIPFVDSVLVKEYEGRPVFAYKTIDGSCPSQADLSAPLAGAAAKALGKLLDASSTFAEFKGQPVNDGEFIADLFHQFMAAHPQVLVAQEFQAMLAFVKRDNCESWLKTSISGLVHGDYFFENIIVRDSEVVGIIDFGDVYHGRIVADLVIGAMEFSVNADESFDLEWMEAFMGPLAPWLRKLDLAPEMFLDLLRLNCIRFAVYTLPPELAQGQTPAQNRYVARFMNLLNSEFASRISELVRGIKESQS
jgi:Ser/Thr protein kinase RdoA (MazF antagonist)